MKPRMHIQLNRDRTRTLCGRSGPWPMTDVIDEATCKSCHRSDDSRSIREYHENCKAMGVEP